jgi:hypothetical protein
MTAFDSDASAPEALIAIAVIEQAFRDIRATVHSSTRRGGASRPMKREADEARQFLTDEAGEWARSRRDFCMLAGLHPDRVREMALIPQNSAPQARPLNTDTRTQISSAERGR